MSILLPSSLSRTISKAKLTAHVIAPIANASSNSKNEVEKDAPPICFLLIRFDIDWRMIGTHTAAASILEQVIRRDDDELTVAQAWPIKSEDGALR